MIPLRSGWVNKDLKIFYRSSELRWFELATVPFRVADILCDLYAIGWLVAVNTINTGEGSERTAPKNRPSEGYTDIECDATGCAPTRGLNRALL